MIVKQNSLDLFIATGIKRAWQNLKQELIKRGHQVVKKGKNYDISYTNIVDPIAYLRLRREKKPKIIYANTTTADIKGAYFFSDFFFKQIARYLKNSYLFGDKLITLTQYSKKCLERMGVKKPIEVISNGVNLRDFKYSKKKRDSFRKKYGIKKDEIVILNVGVISWRKGIDRFVKIAQRIPEARFIWVGHEDLFNHDFFKIFMKNRRKIKQLINNKPKNLLFTGYVEDIVSAYCGADILLFTTRGENEGMPILEAGACKRPLVTTNLEVMKEKINNNKEGYTCNNNKEFINKIRLLINSKSLRNRLGMNAYKMSKKYDNKKSINRIIKIMEEQVQKKNA